MEGRLTDRENTIFKCDNCKFVDCKNDKDTEKLSKGMKVRSKTASEGLRPNGEKFIIPKNSEGIVNAWPFNNILENAEGEGVEIAEPPIITWKLFGGLKENCKYDIKDLHRFSFLYKCK